MGRSKKRNLASNGGAVGGGSSRGRRAFPSHNDAVNVTRRHQSSYFEYIPLVLVTFLAYSPTFSAEMGVWDDEIVFASTQVTNPSALSGLFDIWFDASSGREIHYWPMTYTSFWLEHWLHGLRPGLCHVTNVALHAANACIVRRILGNMGLGDQTSWLAASIFALTPLNVESVAWVIERKDSLSGVFYLSSLMFHPNINVTVPSSNRYQASASTGQSVWISLLLYALGMLSKTSIVSLPAVLLLVPWTIRGRITVAEFKRAVPFFIVGLGMAAYDVSMAKREEPVNFGFTLVERILIASRCVVFYLRKLAYPGVLMVIYPRWNVKEDGMIWASCFVFVVASLVGLFVLRYRLGRAPLAALLFFGGTLFPVLGLIDYGFMSYSFVAERFQYLASIGPIICVSMLVGKLADKFCSSDKTRRLPVTATILALLAYLASRTYSHSSIYHNQETFWSYVVGVNPNAKSAQLNLGNEFLRQDEWSKAEPLYIEALILDPNEAKAMVNIAIVLEKLGRPKEAAVYLEKLIRIQPTNVKALNGLGNVMSSLGRHEEAAKYFKNALDLNPNNSIARMNMGNEYARLGRLEDAVDAYMGAIRAKPTYSKARFGLAHVLGILKRNDEAIEQYRRVLSYDPKNGVAKERLDKLESAKIKQ